MEVKLVELCRQDVHAGHQEVLDNTEEEGSLLTQRAYSLAQGETQMLCRQEGYSN